MLARLDVVLVGTSNAENLGGVARLCENFAMPPMTLVAPRAQPDDHRALVVGRAARQRLGEARVVAALDEAVAGASYVVGFSARAGGDRPMTSLRALPSLLAERAPAGRVALVFGPEDTGLVAADVDRCDAVAAIELPGPLQSLNLTQAVALALWELARPVEPPRARTGGATHADFEALLDHAFDVLDTVGYFRDGEERAERRVYWRRLLASSALTPAQVRGLHGLCAQLLRHHRSTR